MKGAGGMKQDFAGVGKMRKNNAYGVGKMHGDDAEGEKKKAMMASADLAKMFEKKK
jgi:hypothetical protein